MASVKRRIFHRAIGEKLAKLRSDRDLTQGQVEHLSRGLINKNTLKSIEAGRIEHPNPDVLRELARLYSVPYPEIARMFVEATYGRDLARHGLDQSSESSSHVGDQSNVPASPRILELESDVARLKAALDKISDVASQLVKIAKVGVESHSVADARSGRSRRHRKTG